MAKKMAGPGNTNAGSANGIKRPYDNKGRTDIPGRGNAGGGKGKGKRHKKGPAGPSNYGAYKGYEGVDRKDAAALADGEIRDGEKDLVRERNRIRREARKGVTQANNLYDRSKGDLRHIFGESGEQIRMNNQASAKAFKQTQNKTAAAQQALLQQLNNNTVEGADGINAELERLGIQGGADMGQYASNQQNATNIAAITGNNQQSSLAAQSATSKSLGRLLQGMNQGSKASSLGQALNTRNDDIYDIRQGQRDGYNEVREAVSDLRGTRGDLIRQLMQSMSEQGWAQYMDQANLDLAQDAAAQAKKESNRDFRLRKSQAAAYKKRSKSYGGRSYGGSSFTPYGSGESSGGGDEFAGNFGNNDAFQGLALDDLLGGRRAR